MDTLKQLYSSYKPTNINIFFIMCCRISKHGHLIYNPRQVILKKRKLWNRPHKPYSSTLPPPLTHLVLFLCMGYYAIEHVRADRLFGNSLASGYLEAKTLTQNTLSYITSNPLLAI